MRTLINLSENQLSILNRLAKMNRTSLTALVSEAISEYLLRHAHVLPEGPRPIEGFGALKERWGDSLEYQTALRSEWERPAP